MTDNQERTVIREAADVTPEILKDAEDTFDGWYSNDERIEWDDFIDRLSDKCGPYGTPPYEFEEYDNPAVRKIQRHVRAYRDS